MSEDLTLTAADGVSLAVRDHGGPGRPLVLLHGAGTHLEPLGRLAEGLSRYRVVSTDQRWSGQSGDSPVYSWDVLVDDLEAVVAALGLDNPAVIGHSWGGMIADEVDRARTVLMPPVPDWYGSEGDEAWRRKALEEATQAALALRVPEADALAYAARDFVALGGGRWRRHPSPVLLKGLEGDQRMFEVYRQVAAPLLIVLAGQSRGLPEGVAELMDAYRRGLARALSTLTRERPNVKLAILEEADHVGLAGRYATRAAETVQAFLGAAGYGC